MIPRIIKNKLKDSPKSVLLLGPRQVGKSTVCQQLNPDITINLADEREYRSHLQDAGLVSRIVKASAAESLVFIDEVQRIPSILNSIQALIDAEPGRKFLLTGSSARKLKKGKANLLPGRIFVEHLSPLLFWELGEKLDLEKALQQGTLPEVYLQDYGPKLLESYVDTYLREEIQAEAATRDLGAYARFLDLAAELHGQHLNYSKISSDSEIKKETVRRYFSILEDTLLVERIPAFSEVENKRRVRQKDRFVFFDLGVRNALLRKHHTRPTNTERGHLFEQWLFLQVLHYCRLYDKPWKISSFATPTTGIEVDMLIDTGSTLLAVEVKYRENIQAKMAKGLYTFERMAKREARKIIVYTGQHRQILDNQVEALPVEVFLAEIIPAL